MKPAAVLVVEDDFQLRESICDTLDLANIPKMDAENAETALAILAKENIMAVVSDINMPGMDGHQLLAEIQKQYPSTPVVLMTAFSDVKKAVSAIKLGAMDYLVKPFAPSVLVKLLKNLTLNADESMIAEDISSKSLVDLAAKVANSYSTVLITGESGTGKEVLARYIHQHSPRADQPFVAINCAAIPETMLEATLFGHEKGAFTGASQSQAGKFEQANGGTLLLDEISEMNVGLQAKLLRVLQEKEVERVGGKKLITLDVRIIATTNRNIEEDVALGRFREDLFYRLNVFPLQWHPLRERRDDILPIAEKMVAKHAVLLKKGAIALSKESKDMLYSYAWPGNVRELDNVIQRALVLAQGNEVKKEDLMITHSTRVITAGSSSSLVNSHGAAPANHSSAGVVENLVPGDSLSALGEGVQRHEFELIIDTLQSVNWRKKQAAEVLGISARTLRYKLAKMREAGIDLGSSHRATNS